MALGFKHFHSGQAGAPVLTGQVGKLIDLLDWILDITDEEEGWEKVFSGTNAAVYRMRYGLQAYLDVNDNGVLPGGARDARVRGYEAMTGLGNGTSPFPLLGSLAYPSWRKAGNPGSTPVRYWGIKTANMLLLFVEATSYVGDGFMYVAGQMPSLHPAENYPFILSVMNDSQGYEFDHSSYGAFSGSGSSPGWGGDSVSTAHAGSWMRNPSGAIKAVSGSLRRVTGSPYSIADGTEVALVRAEAMFTDVNLGSGTLKPRSYVPNLWTTAANLAAAGWAVGDVFTIPEYNPSAQFKWVGRNSVNVILEITDTGGAV